MSCEMSTAFYFKMLNEGIIYENVPVRVVYSIKQMMATQFRTPETKVITIKHKANVWLR